MYKDKVKQKQANKEAAQRRRDKVKGMTEEGMTEEGITIEGMIVSFPRADNPDVQATWDRRNAQGQATIYDQPLRAVPPIRPSLPGDPDYDGVCLDDKYDSHRRAEPVTRVGKMSRVSQTADVAV